MAIGVTGKGVYHRDALCFRSPSDLNCLAGGIQLFPRYRLETNSDLPTTESRQFLHSNDKLPSWNGDGSSIPNNSPLQADNPKQHPRGVFDNSSDNRSDGNGALHGSAASDGRIYVDNILDEALATFREHYHDSSIVKDDIFRYVYGILHHPGYREKYKNDLFKELPRIPFAPDFWAFSEAGEQLAYIHANYDQLEGWEGKMKVEYSDDFDPDNREHWRIEKMRWADDNKTLKLNDHITLRNIPAGAHTYKIADNSPIQEFAKQIIRKEYEDSGIVNDRNDLFNHNPPEVLLRARQLIEVGVKTSEILAKLPETFETIEESRLHNKKVS